MSDEIDNYTLRKYFHNEVVLDRQDAQQSQQVVNRILNGLISTISQNDQLFGDNLQPVGSVPAKLKVREPDEFDFEVPLKICSSLFAELHWHKHSARKKPRFYTADQRGRIQESFSPLDLPPQGYCHVTMQSECQCGCDCVDVTFNGDLIPSLIKFRTRRRLKKAINQLNWRDLVKVSTKDHGPTITIYIKNINGDLPVDQVNVDLVPTLHLGLPIPPRSAWLGWPRRNAKWPGTEMVQEIQNRGVNFVAKKPVYWLVSFADVEVLLSEKIDRDGGCRKQCHRIMKTLNINEWSRCDEPEDLTSYALKNALFWMCERHWRSEDWNQDCLTDRFNDMVEYVLDCLEKQYLPQYFCPHINLLQNCNPSTLDWIAMNIRDFLNNPTRILLGTE